MNIDNLPQEMFDKKPTVRQWMSNLVAKLKLIPDELVSLKVTEDFSSLNVEKLNRKFVLDTSAKKLYFVANGNSYEIKLT